MDKDVKSSFKVYDDWLFITTDINNNDVETDMPECELLIPQSMVRELIIKSHVPPTSEYMGTT